MPFSAPVLTYRAKALASNMCSKVLNGHIILTDTSITTILAPEMTYTPQITPSLRSLDYNPFFPSNRSRAIKRIITRLFSTEINQLDSLACDCIYLPMAINTDKSDALRKGESNAVITSASPNTQKALNVLNKEIIRLISQILIDLTELNTACDNSFHWNDIEKKLSDVPKPDSSLSAFFSKYDFSK